MGSRREVDLGRFRGVVVVVHGSCGNGLALVMGVGGCVEAGRSYRFLGGVGWGLGIRMYSGRVG